MKILTIKVDLDNPEICQGMEAVYNLLYARFSDAEDAVTVVLDLKCQQLQKKTVLPFKIRELSQEDISFIRGVTETVQDIEALRSLGAVHER